MATRRFLVFLAGALAIGIGAAWVASDLRPVFPGSQSCQVGVAYAVDVTDDQATFDLPFEKGGRYRLIIASVAPQDVESSITLSAEPVSAVERFPLREVPPLQSAIPRQLNTSWQPLEINTTTPFVPQGVPPVPLEVNTTTPFVPQGVPPNEMASAERTFFLHVTDGPLDDPRQYAKVRSRRIAEGRRVRIFLDANTEPAQLAKGLVPEIIRLFDEKIVPGSRDVLGEYRDVDGDGKFAILISPWLGRLQGGKTALGGFVRGSDFQKSVRPPLGNRADVMYLSANLRPGPHLHSLLAHEFAHAICFSERLPTKLHPEGLPTEEDWLNEAIAHLAENLHGSGWTNLDYRVSRFLDDTASSPLVVENYYAGGLWRDPGCRGATYLFLRFVVDQFGTDVLGRLIRNPERGAKNLETATGAGFADLFRSWTIALATAGRADSASRGQFTSLDLHQRLGRWGLQGVKTSPWNLESEAPEFSLKGTCAKVFDVQAETAGIYRLRVRTVGHPKLQVTLIRLEDDLPTFKAKAAWQTVESGAGVQDPALRVSIPSSLKIVRASVECRQGKHCQSVCILGDDISIQTVAGKGKPQQTFSLKLPGRMFPRQAASSGEWQLKILAKDAAGRIAARWIDLSPPPVARSREPIPLAEKSERKVF